MKPSIKDRIARHDAMNAECEQNETVRMNRVIEHMRFQKEHKQRVQRMQFDMALLADRIVNKLEQMRDESRPKSYGEEWNDEFCAAVKLLPAARAFAEECEINCTEVKEK